MNGDCELGDGWTFGWGACGVACELEGAGFLAVDPPCATAAPVPASSRARIQEIGVDLCMQAFSHPEQNYANRGSSWYPDVSNGLPWVGARFKPGQQALALQHPSEHEPWLESPETLDCSRDIVDPGHDRRLRDFAAQGGRQQPAEFPDSHGIAHAGWQPHADTQPHPDHLAYANSHPGWDVHGRSD